MTITTTSAKKMYYVRNNEDDKFSQTKLNVTIAGRRTDCDMKVNRKTLKGAYKVFVKAVEQAVNDGIISAKTAQFANFADDINDIDFGGNDYVIFTDSVDNNFAYGIDDNSDCDLGFYFWFWNKDEEDSEVTDSNEEENKMTIETKISASGRISLELDGSKISIDNAVKTALNQNNAVTLKNENGDYCTIERYDAIMTLGNYNFKFAIRQFAKGEKVTGATVCNKHEVPVIKANAEFDASETAITDAALQVAIDAELALAKRFMGYINYTFADETSAHWSGDTQTELATAEQIANWIITFAAKHPTYTITTWSIEDWATYNSYRATEADLQALNTPAEVKPDLTDILTRIGRATVRYENHKIVEIDEAGYSYKIVNGKRQYRISGRLHSRKDFEQFMLQFAEYELTRDRLFGNPPADPNEDDPTQARYTTFAYANSLGDTNYAIRSTDFRRAENALSALKNNLPADKYTFGIDFVEFKCGEWQHTTVYHAAELDGSEDDRELDDVFNLLPELDELNDFSETDPWLIDDDAEYTDRDARFNRGEKIAAELTAKLRPFDPTVEVTFGIDEDGDFFFLKYDGIYGARFTATGVEPSFHSLKQSDKEIAAESSPDFDSQLAKLQAEVNRNKNRHDAAKAALDAAEATYYQSRYTMEKLLDEQARALHDEFCAALADFDCHSMALVKQPANKFDDCIFSFEVTGCDVRETTSIGSFLYRNNEYQFYIDDYRCRTLARYDTADQVRQVISMLKDAVNRDEFSFHFPTVAELNKSNSKVA